MPKLLYLDDSYLREFEAVVVALDGANVFLDQTAFYPESGGQPHDTGTLTRIVDSGVFQVADVRKISGDIAHVVGQGLKSGDRVIGVIDWGRRYKLMRMHSAAHVLSAVFHQNANALIAGNQLGFDMSRIDFSLENFDRGKIDSYFQEANGVIAKNLKVRVGYMPRSEAEKDSSLFKLAKELPSSIKELRIVEIVGFDRQADGGTHIKQTSEIGRIKFLKAENKGKSNRRVYFQLE